MASSWACCDGLADGVGRVGEVGPGHAQVHGQGDQPLLGAVVQVAFDPAALGVGGGHDLGPAAGQRLDPQRQLLGCGRGRAGPGRRPRRPGPRPAPPSGAASSMAADSTARPRPCPAAGRPQAGGEDGGQHGCRPADRHQRAAGGSTDQGQQVVAELPPGGRCAPGPHRPQRPASRARRGGGAGISTPRTARNRTRCRVPNARTHHERQHRPGQGGRCIDHGQSPAAGRPVDQAPDRGQPDDHQPGEHRAEAPTPATRPAQGMQRRPPASWPRSARSCDHRRRRRAHGHAGRPPPGCGKPHPGHTVGPNDSPAVPRQPGAGTDQGGNRR